MYTSNNEDSPIGLVTIGLRAEDGAGFGCGRYRVGKYLVATSFHIFVRDFRVRV